MPKGAITMDDDESLDGSLHDESKVEQDVHAKEQMDGELLDDVQKTNGTAGRAEAEEAEESEDSDEEGDPEVFEVESIEGHKFVKGEIFYRIHWKGYDSKDDYTWEPIENLETAKAILARYHHKIRGKPELKKQKSTSSLKRQATDDSPGPKPPKHRKADDAETWRPKKEDWEPDVDRIDTIERDENGQLLVFILFKNQRKIKVSMDQIYRHCPRPMLKFYESHLHFN